MSKNQRVDLQFRPKARLIHLIGENLLRDEVTALLELVKNAYDADAATCVIRFEALGKEDAKIIIDDDGTGMDISVLTTAWVEPGTSYKIRKPVTPKGRRVQGEKGIGRFAVDKLARRLDMYTKTEGMMDVIHFTIDWQEFDDADKYLEDVKAQYSFEKMPFKEHGAKLVLTKLRKTWNLADVSQVRYGLIRLIPPTGIPAHKFEVDLQVPDHPYMAGIVRNDVIERAPFRVIAKLENGEAKAKILRRLPSDKSETERLIIVQGKEGEVSPEKLKSIGPVDIDIGAFLKVKHYGRAPQGFFPTVQISKADEETLEQWHGVSIYSDGFWIYPYGETWFDWLGLAQRRVQRPGRRFDNNQLVGFVNISRDRNPGLVQQINREGLVHNESYDILSSVVISVLAALEADAVASGARKRVALSKTETEVAPSSLAQNVEDNLSHLQRILDGALQKAREGAPSEAIVDIQSAMSEIGSLKAEVERDFIMYERHAILGLFVANVIHEINVAADPLRLRINALENFLSDVEIEASSKEKALTNLKAMDDDLENLIGQIQRWNPFIKKDEPTAVVELCKYIEGLRPELERRYPNLKIEVICKEPAAARVASMYFLSIIQNLVDNSNYWTSSQQEPLVRITIDRVADMAIMRVSDNGRGIRDEDKKNVFIPTWSLKPDGSGLGLKLAGEAAFILGGRLVLMRDSEIGTGATFELRLPVVRSNGK